MALTVVKENLEAVKTQLESYQNTLQKAHGNSLRLRSFGVVSLGYERLLWVEI